MNIKDYISIKLAGTAARTTLGKRINWLARLANEFEGATDFSFLNDFKKVKKFLDSSNVISTKWTWLWHVLAAIQSDPKLINKDALKQYEALKDEFGTELSAKTADTKKTPKQEIRLASDLDAIQAELRAKIVELYKNTKLEYRVPTVTDLRRMDLSFAKKLQDLVILGCYIFQPALRNDWGLMKYTNAKKDIDTKHNWLYMRGSTALIMMNDYKNVKSLGHQEIVVRPELVKLLKIWLAVVKHFTGSGAEYVLYYEIVKTKSRFDHMPNDEALRKQIARAGLRVLGSPRSINDYRHAHEIAIQADPGYSKLSMDEKQKLHNELLHGTWTALYYNVV